ncbi:class I SAM-dependent methyltransferase [Helcobacillus massiliensis]|uniref:Putative O-methyltransferase YrrM n=1 Tax=Helcobacillus massiliensis TaxID=521392 RepID=A0A839QT03_9MICO|nr:class I SAM-dependent methyltransferase [Helcobacillus massiliensis]MCG7427537.1 class I SAM-dependent methyltransferase [Helcobacillus sp. ACRRO]MBB3022778.1 putative O-methyltransferase YrrM [Helcobacillus massiliensis]MCT1558218.1 class I SAM-dependent methyltransferase [Helcobacillus massiliensis]MCT2036427.1 class I SAM-dependent methyltransferase [Helcobacillus massiliensis]MCT2332231.1 class I SAM-dependent methyltransferase [Helcobacillus massiliensis]
MASGKIASWAFGEEFIDEDELFPVPGLLARARERGNELGVAPLLRGAAAQLRTSAAMVRAQSVVEIGTGSGVGSLYLLSGMTADGVLTTIDYERENQRAARAAFDEAGIRTNRVRTIAGQALDVVSRLSDRAYDMVVFSADHPQAAQLFAQSARVLRSGGVTVVTNVLFHDRVADPVARDATTQAIRSLLRAVHDDDQFLSSLSSSGDGVLTAVRR